ncbi:MAG: hypothetical protein ABFC95_06520 [Smithella sp.]|jgi:hypothetical protein
MAEIKEEEKSKNAIGDKLIATGCAAYGIDKKYAMSSRYDEAAKEAIIVTVGGSKVRFKEGDKVLPLGEIAITGINPAKRKPITGVKK